MKQKFLFRYVKYVIYIVFLSSHIVRNFTPNARKEVSKNENAKRTRAVFIIPGACYSPALYDATFPW